MVAWIWTSISYPSVPVILGSMFKAQQIEVVLQSKAFSGQGRRTYLHDSVLGWNDWLMIILMILFTLAFLVFYFAWGLGRFNGPLA